MSTKLEEIILNLEQRIRTLEQSQKLRSVSPFLSNSLNQVSGAAKRVNINSQYYIDADGIAYLKEGYFTGSTQDIYDSDNLEGTGFLNRTDSTISFDGTTKIFTIAPVSTSFTLYIKNVKILKTTETVTIENTNGLHYIYYNASGVLSESTSVWDLLAGISPVAMVYLLGTTYRLMDERHGCSMPAVTHDYLHNSIGARYASGLSATFGNTTFSVAAGVIYDEDIKHSIGSQTQCAVFYRQSGLWNWTAKQNAYYLSSGGILQYDNAGVVDQVGSNSYVACYILATNDVDSPIISITGQRTDITLAAAIANNTFSTLSLTGLPFKEYRHIYTVILRNDATPYEQAFDHRLDSSIGVSNVAVDRYIQIITNPATPPSGYGLVYLDEADGNNPKIKTPDGSVIRLVWQEN